MRRTRTAILLAAVLALAGCGKTGMGGESDSDTVPDGVSDVFPDIGPDVGPEILPDLPPDIAPDIPPDIAPDIPPDIAPDVPPDIVPDVPPDIAPDIVPDIVPDVPPDIAPDIVPDPWPDTPPDVMPDGATGRVVGDPCRRDFQCDGVPGTGRMCLTNLYGYVDFPGGYCSASCTSGTECGVGASCVSLYGFMTLCLKNCTTFFDCRYSEGYTCSSVGSGSPTFCIPPLPGPDGGPIDP